MENFPNTIERMLSKLALQEKRIDLSRPSDPSIRHSRTSLHNGDDRDSMAEFNDEKDRGRFTEDGSFIGQYGRDDKRRTYLIKYDESEGFTNGNQENSPSTV